MLLSVGISMTKVSFISSMLSKRKARACSNVGAASTFAFSTNATKLTYGQIYNAILDAAIPSSWHKHVVGMSALLLKQRPIDLSSPLEVFMISRSRGAQVSHHQEVPANFTTRTTPMSHHEIERVSKPRLVPKIYTKPPCCSQRWQRGR